MTDWPCRFDAGIPTPETAAARTRLGLLPTERVPMWAAHWIVAGYDGESLVLLAGLHGDDPFDVRDALSGALRDCGVAVPGSIPKRRRSPSPTSRACTSTDGSAHGG
jgi:hypothetical protein